MNCFIKKIAFKLGLHLFSSKRKFNDRSFIFQILIRKLICFEILEVIGMSNPTFFARSKITFNESYHKQSYGFNER